MGTSLNRIDDPRSNIEPHVSGNLSLLSKPLTVIHGNDEMSRIKKGVTTPAEIR